MKLLGSWSTGFLPGQNLTLSLAKHAPLANILQISAHRQTHTHSYTHTVKAVSLSPSMALFSTAKPFNHPTDTVSHHCSHRLRIAYIPLLCDTGYCADGRPQTTCATACVFLCVS